MKKPNFLRKHSVYFIVLVALFLLFLAYFFSADYYAGNIKWGVSFSPLFASSLGLDPRKTYRDILDELKVDNIRIGAYWSDIEKEKGKYNFDDLDWYVREAEARGAAVTIAVGRRLPRWPECHIPSWARMEGESSQQEKVLEFLRQTVERYKFHPNIIRWQVENEPLLDLFGECARGDRRFLIKEIELVKSLDARPVMITDSGELSSWRRTIKLGDYFGTTLYTKVGNKYIGYFRHFFPPAFYNWKARIWNKDLDTVVISEMQAEPWVMADFPSSSKELLLKAFSTNDFRRTLSIARRTGIKEIYLWGAEYWYYMKEKRGDSSFLEEAKKLWQ